jgi:hypothetical protein
MKASELFPGAWVRWNVEDNSGKPIQTIEMVVEVSRVNAYSLGCTVPAPLEDLEPIPLTPEILTEWFGFEMIHRSGVSEGWFKGTNPVTKDYLVYLKRIRDGTPFFFDNGHHEMKYVHQLQRLYHALTGEPLKRI